MYDVSIYERRIELNTITLNEMQNKKNKFVLLDMRGEISYQNGHIPNAILYSGLENIVLDKSTEYIVYCTYGEKSIAAADELNRNGYYAKSLIGGYTAWLRQEMSEFERYERQMIMPEVGINGQRSLSNAKVLVVGAGGLGCPALQYLAGAGVGTIGIVDADNVSITNLHRQILHPEKNVGKNKAESAKEILSLLNEKIKINVYPIYLQPENINQIIKDYDFIIDAVDNFETKFLINDACVIAKKPFCHAGVIQFHGQVMTYVPGKGPCYRCIFEDIPQKGSIETCSQAGVIGAVAGIIGCVQAAEAIKYILKSGKLLTGAMFVFDALNLKTKIVNFQKCNPSCRVCGKNADIKDVYDNCNEYTYTCTI